VRIPVDPALPRLRVLLDPDAMSPLLARSLGRAARLGAVRIARVSYKPGERVVVHYQAAVDGRPEDVVVRAVAGRSLEARAGRAQVLELARRVDGRSPAATPIVYDRDAGALVTWLPLDPRLPALAEAPRLLAQRLRDVGLPAASAPAEPQRLAYKPGRRATLRLGEQVLKVYGSPRQLASGAAGLRAGAALSGIGTPRFDGLVEPLGLTVQEAVDGTPVASAAVAAEAGVLLQRLQRTRVPGLVPAPGRAQLQAAIRKAALIATVVPELAGRVQALVGRLSRSAPPASPLVPAHGDFHAGQLLRVGSALYVLDFDSLCLASPALDLAEFAAATSEAGPEAAAAVLDALADGYGALPGELDWHLAVAVLVRASHPFHRALPDWPDRVERLVGTAEAVVAGRGAPR
jgi:Phosphotransferase enzyme family